MEGFSPASLPARASEIAKSRDELLQLLNELPEFDYELSFTDLVEKEGSTEETGAVTKEKSAQEAEEAKERRPTVNETKRRDRGSSCSSSSEGVLLNFYVPTSLMRSRTAARPSRGVVDQRANTECNKRDREPAALGCWSALWDRGRGKSRRAILQTGR